MLTVKLSNEVKVRRSDGAHAVESGRSQACESPVFLKTLGIEADSGNHHQKRMQSKGFRHKEATIPNESTCEDSFCSSSGCIPPAQPGKCELLSDGENQA